MRFRFLAFFPVDRGQAFAWRFGDPAGVWVKVGRKGQEAFCEQALVARIRGAFPAVAAEIDARLARDGFSVNEAYHVWIEQFSQITTDALKRGDLQTAGAYLRLISGLLGTATESAARLIDVAYVEPLMWDIKDDAVKREGWAFFPANLRKLYCAFWGEQPFMMRRP